MTLGQQLEIPKKCTPKKKRKVIFEHTEMVLNTTQKPAGYLVHHGVERNATYKSISKVKAKYTGALYETFSIFLATGEVKNEQFMHCVSPNITLFCIPSELKLLNSMELYADGTFRAN